MEVVRAHFRPEFLNRLDEIILFHRLSAAHMGPIVDIQIVRLQKLLEDRKIKLELTDAARAWLGRVGYDPVYGARPLKRAVQKYLQDPLADKILSGEIPDGSVVRVDEGDGELVLTPADKKCERQRSKWLTLSAALGARACRHTRCRLRAFDALALLQPALGPRLRPHANLLCAEAAAGQELFFTDQLFLRRLRRRLCRLLGRG